MKKRILFIGGSLFVGRVFNIMASMTGDYELHVVNRGYFPLNLEGVAEYKCNRHAGRMLVRLLPDDTVFDAVIDTCARSPGDISIITDALGMRIRQYILISTGVYEPNLRKVKTETDAVSDDPAHPRLFLENELRSVCGKLNVPYTILRPTRMYGPMNYHPNESMYIELIARKHTVPVPLDATAYFNLVYVKDVARVIMLVIGDPRAYGETFNLAAPERVSYTRLISDFERLNGGSFDTREVTIEEAVAEHLPLPFPATEDDITDGEKFTRTFPFTYTSFTDGMEETFKVFYSLYTT